MESDINIFGSTSSTVDGSPAEEKEGQEHIEQISRHSISLINL